MFNNERNLERMSNCFQFSCHIMSHLLPGFRINGRPLRQKNWQIRYNLKVNLKCPVLVMPAEGFCFSELKSAAQVSPQTCWRGCELFLLSGLEARNLRNAKVKEGRVRVRSRGNGALCRL